MEEFEIDDFEKLYAITAAKLNSSEEISDATFNENDFDKICNLGKYKLEHENMFSKEYKNPQENDRNYYIISRTVNQKVRIGNKEELISNKAYVLTDYSGAGLYIIMENGTIFKTAELREQEEIAYDRYNEFIKKGIITKDQLNQIFEASNINEVMGLINDGFTLEDVQVRIDSEMKARGIKLPEENLQQVDNKSEVQKQPQEKEKQSLEEKELSEEVEESLEMHPGLVEMLASKHHCNIYQISFRKIDDLEKVEEDTGLNLRHYRGKVIALKINYGYMQRYYLVNSETGEIFNRVRQGNIEIENTPEIEDYFKYPTKRTGENARSLRNDEGRSYISSLDEDGNIVQVKYVNNGKADDMIKTQRERYIVEVNETTQVLEDAIDEYQQNNTQENWLRVKDAMNKRILVDKKYNVLEKQKELTKETLEETIDETLVKNGMADSKSKDDDEEDWFVRSRF